MMLHGKWLFLLINTLGGIAVLGSYYYGYASNPEGFPQLWGGVPDSLIPLYSVSMYAAASGYLLTFAFILCRVDGRQCRANGGLIMTHLNWLYAAILFCSALWLPMTAGVLGTGLLDLWWGTRAVLLVTGFSAVAVWWQLWSLRSRETGWFLHLALLGQAAFCWQTLGLDALVWPYYFPV